MLLLAATVNRLLLVLLVCLIYWDVKVARFSLKRSSVFVTNPGMPLVGFGWYITASDGRLQLPAKRVAMKARLKLPYMRRRPWLWCVGLSLGEMLAGWSRSHHFNR